MQQTIDRKIELCRQEKGLFDLLAQFQSNPQSLQIYYSHQMALIQYKLYITQSYPDLRAAQEGLGDARMEMLDIDAEIKRLRERIQPQQMLQQEISGRTQQNPMNASVPLSTSFTFHQGVRPQSSDPHKDSSFKAGLMVGEAQGQLDVKLQEKDRVQFRIEVLESHVAWFNRYPVNVANTLSLAMK